MHFKTHGRAAASAIAALGLIAAGCGDDGGGGTGTPTVAISGMAQVAIGATTTLTATTTNGTDTGYAWASANTSVATVDATSGVVTGVAAGETVVRATGNATNATGSFPVVVLADSEQMPRVVLDVDSVFLEAGTETDVSATTENGSDASYDWTSSDPDVAMVTASGASTTVTAVRSLPDGEFAEVTITATGADTGASAAVALVIGVEVPPGIAWAGSGHANSDSEAFRHWDEDGEVPTRCAKCHSTSGLLDFYGKDGATLETVDEAVALGETVECAACHSETVYTIKSVPFPGGRINQFDEFAAVQTCMSCHQGRASTDTVDGNIMNPGEPDEVEGDLGFSNIHYYAAAATLFAGQVRGAYQYEGQVYDWRFRHVPAADNCIGCHSPHSLELKTDLCASCHGAVNPTEIRMPTSREDYDGDGLCPSDECTGDEPIAGEIAGMRETLYEALTTYSQANAATDSLCYSAGSYPYVFVDQNDDGVCDDDDLVDGSLVRYSTFTPRIAKAAYNYQAATVEPGAFAHNAKYFLQAMYDGIIDLNTGIVAVGGTPLDASGLTRGDKGHFNGAGEAARHWDEDVGVSASCSQCHSGSEGFKFFIETGMTEEVPEQANGLDCAVCHANQGNAALGERPDAPADGPGGADFAIRGGPIDADGNPYIPFPGVEEADRFSSGNAITDMCSTCHSGRSSGPDVEAAIASAGVADDDTVFNRRFINVHYKAAGATRYGSQSNVGAEFPGNSYPGFDGHLGGGDNAQCNFCHAPADNNHSFAANDQLATCAASGCHTGITDVREIRIGTFGVDYDGDGNSGEDLYDEIGYLGLMANGMSEDVNDCFNAGGDIIDDTCGMSDILLVAMNDYADATPGVDNICFKPDSYPYFFVDVNGDSYCGADDNSSYGTWTGNLLRAAYNYQLSHTEPGIWAHNRAYATALLYDSIEALGGDVSALTR